MLPALGSAAAVPISRSCLEAEVKVYLFSNGLLRAAVAVMTAGYDGRKDPLSGLPKGGSGMARFEAISLLP